MEKNTDTQMISMQIISASGYAKSAFVAAIDAASSGDYSEADKLMADGREKFVEGHQAHSKLLTAVANGEKLDFDLLLVHAQDQMASAETIEVLAERIISILKEKSNTK